MDDHNESVWMSVDTDPEIIAASIESIRRNPRDPTYYYRLFDAYRRRGQDAQALDVAFSVSRVSPSLRSFSILVGLIRRRPFLLIDRYRNRSRRT